MTFCQSKGQIPYFETSAKEAINVEQAFEGKCFVHRTLSLVGLQLRIKICSHCKKCSCSRGIRRVQWGFLRPNQHSHRKRQRWLCMLDFLKMGFWCAWEYRAWSCVLPFQFTKSSCNGMALYWGGHVYIGSFMALWCLVSLFVQNA